MKTRYATYTIIAATAIIGLAHSFDAVSNTIDTENRGRWVAESADRYDSGFINQSASVTMILRNAQGQTAKRELRIKVLEVEGDGDKSLTIFDTPRDVKGTSLLTFSHAVTPDDQWLYLPALKRVKRINSKNKSGPFMGSEFAYEDLASQEVDKYTYTLSSEEEVLGESGYVIERKPVDPNSGYARQLMWIDGVHWRTGKIEYYDRRNELLKTLVYSDYRQYPNKKWRPDRMEMINHQTGKSTTLILDDIEFDTNVYSHDFNKNALKRVR